MKKAIVTGASGFVGSWLCNHLSQNNVFVYAIVRDKNSDIRRLNNDGIEIIYCELEKIIELDNIIIDKDIDAFYHLAWSGSSGPQRADYKLQLLNVKYACDCAKVSKEMNCKKFLCSGTITEKIAQNILDIDIKSENTMYGLAKHTTHCMLDILCKNIDLDYIWMRFSNIYGPCNTSGNIVGYTLNELTMGNVPQFSKGEQPYDLMYIKDLVNAMYLLGKNKTSENCYFLGSGEPKLLKDYLIKIKEIYSHSCDIGLGKRKEDGLEYNIEWFDIKDLENDTGFKPKYTFEEGIKETIDFMKNV